jgi:hypothetical protein
MYLWKVGEETTVPRLQKVESDFGFLSPASARPVFVGPGSQTKATAK